MKNFDLKEIEIEKNFCLPLVINKYFDSADYQISNAQIFYEYFKKLNILSFFFNSFDFIYKIKFEEEWMNFEGILNFFFKSYIFISVKQLVSSRYLPLLFVYPFIF